MLLALLAGIGLAQAAPRVTVPAEGSVVFGRDVPFEVEGCARLPRVRALELDGRATRFARELDRTVYESEWEGAVALAGEGEHRLKLTVECAGKSQAITRSFSSRTRGTVAVGAEVARHFMKKHRARKLAWNWGPAVFLYSLGHFLHVADRSLDIGALEYLTEYHQHWSEKGMPDIDRSDRVAPALSALFLAELGRPDLGLANAQAGGALYVKSEPRNRLGALDHLGHSALRIFYPHTIWVDSLMMYGVLAARWGNVSNDPELLEFAAKQPLIFAAALQDPKVGLFRHAWRVEREKPIPKSETYWLRGNGWVLAATAAIIDELPPWHPLRARLVRVFEKTAYALMEFQQKNGLWDTVANLPGYAYPETSGSALVAYALARGVKRGWLPRGPFLDGAKRAFAAIAARLERRDSGLSMPGISWSTNPSPRWVYRLTPRGHDAPYGVGPFVMAAVELEGEEF